jgi:hypothetical protein|nr:MAG TPA: hypothetical protein [Caudoviricetes sp.]
MACVNCSDVLRDGGYFDGYTPPPVLDQLRGGLTPYPPKNFQKGILQICVDIKKDNVII